MTNDMRVRRGLSATPSFALIVWTADGDNLPTNGIVNGLDLPTGSLAEDVLVSRREHACARPVECGRGSGVPALPHGLRLSLAGDSENHGAGQRRPCSSIGGAPRGVDGTSPQLVPPNVREDGHGTGGDAVVPTGGNMRLGRADSCVFAVAWF